MTKPNENFEMSTTIPISQIDPSKRRKRKHPFANSHSEGIAYDAFTPIRGWILVEREEAATMAGAIHLVSKGDEERRYEVTTAVVHKLGPCNRTGKTGADIPWTVKPGDRIILRKFAGHDILLNGNRAFVLCDEEDIDATIENGVEFEQIA